MSKGKLRISQQQITHKLVDCGRISSVFHYSKLRVFLGAVLLIGKETKYTVPV